MLNSSETNTSTDFSRRDTQTVYYSVEFRLPIEAWSNSRYFPQDRISFFESSDAQPITEKNCEKELDGFTKNKLNHQLSNLTDAAPMTSAMALAEVVQRTQLGKFGSTEVHPKQAW